MIGDPADFDSSDSELLVKLEARIATLEARMGSVEVREAHEERLMRRLRKLLAAWVGED